MNYIDKNNYDNKVFEELETQYMKWLAHFFRPHIACFSDKEDMLSQWRAYANDGQGVAIGFNMEYFKDIKDKDPNRDFIIDRVIYNSDEQKKLLHNKMKTFIKELRQATEQGEFFFLTLASGFFELGQIFKDSSFAEEREIRIIHGNSERAAEHDILKYRVTENSIRSYLEIPLASNVTNVKAIKEIVIGPKCIASEFNLKEFCIRHYELFDSKYILKRSLSSYR